ncbi:hypothetical protein SCB71_10580 [Herbiconiux sp. KACC 21604]|uniref:hypothetical protein n=1 Tax=unclassified Herbiconiux TaxID=2618217 RepID=UPI001492AC40|nr:hypothetical protein [Herbiconiux sp. SALV-R1]QJU53675.1 hypothetical protein HL652_08530 [Herbiconiux sp. SALV-R1]WPO84678.1 hypothetical protein SCB71_10580 [Herbiconiux sp. KACC 21604]
MGDITRRDLMRGGAWAVPVVAVAVAAPAAAASTTPITLNLLYIGPNNGEYVYRVLVEGAGAARADWPYEVEVLELDSATWDVHSRGTLDVNGISFFFLSPQVVSSYLAVRVVALQPSGEVIIGGPLNLPPA